MSDQLQHSAKGTHWSKKDHKYLRKEGNKYIYAEDASNGTTKQKHKTLFTLAEEDIQKSLDEKEKKRVQRNQDLKNSWDQNIADPLNKINPISKAKSRKEKQDQMNRRLNTIARMNKREEELKQKQHLQAQQKTLREPAKVNAYQKQELEKNRSKFEADAKRSAMNARFDRIERQKSDEANARLLKRANENKLNSGVRGGRTARDILSEKGTTRVIYADGKDGNGNSVRAKRVVSKRPSYDDRGFKTGDITVEDSYTRKSVNHPGGTARDMISRKGTRRVAYEKTNDKKKGLRVTTNRDYSKSKQLVESWMMNPDRRNVFKKTADKIQRKVTRGKLKVTSLFKRNKTKKPNKDNIPLNMRMKRDIKKWKRERRSSKNVKK